MARRQGGADMLQTEPKPESCRAEELIEPGKEETRLRTTDVEAARSVLEGRGASSARFAQGQLAGPVVGGTAAGKGPRSAPEPHTGSVRGGWGRGGRSAERASRSSTG